MNKVLCDSGDFFIFSGTCTYIHRSRKYSYAGADHIVHTAAIITRRSHTFIPLLHFVISAPQIYSPEARPYFSTYRAAQPARFDYEK